MPPRELKRLRPLTRGFAPPSPTMREREFGLVRLLAVTVLLAACARSEVAVAPLASSASSGCNTLCGRVLDDQTGEPIRRFSVAVFSRDPNPSLHSFALPRGYPMPPGPLVMDQQFSSADGTFRLPPLSSKTVVINVVTEGRMVWESGSIDLPAAERLEIRLKRAWRIGGRVTDDRGSGLAGVGVYYDSPRVEQADIIERIRGVAPIATTESNGRFTLADVRRPGLPFALIFVGKGFLPQRIQGTAATPETTIDVKLRRGVAVEGVLQDLDGHPASSGAVMAEPVEGEKFLALVNRDGHFHFDALPPGIVRLSASRSLIENPAERRLELDLASSVDVDVSTKRDLRLTLPAAATLRGSMTGLTRNVSGYWVQVRCGDKSIVRPAGSNAEFRITVPAEPCDVSGWYDAGEARLMTDTVPVAGRNGEEVTAKLAFVNPTEIAIVANERAISDLVTITKRGADNWRFTISADGDHVYRFAGLPAGSYELAIPMLGATYHASIDAGSSRRFAFELAAKNAELSVDPPSANVAVLHALYGSGQLRPERPPQFFGDGEGKFLASYVPEGDYQVSIEAPGYVSRTVDLHVPGGAPKVKLDPVPYPFSHPAAAAPLADDEISVLEVVARQWVDEAKAFWRANREPRGRLVLLNQTARPRLLADTGRDVDELERMKRSPAFKQLQLVGGELRDITAVGGVAGLLPQPLDRLPLEERAQWEHAQTEIDTIDLEGFYERYPKAAGLLMLSRVALAGDEALVVGECAIALSIESRLIHLRRRNGRWRIDSSVTLQLTPGC